MTLIFRSCRGEEREREHAHTHNEEIVAENIPNLGMKTNIKIQEAREFQISWTERDIHQEAL